MQKKPDPDPQPAYTAPDHLRPDTARFYLTACNFFGLEPEESRLFLLACEAYDRGQDAREVLEDKGFTFNDRFGQPKSRPEVAVVRDAALVFARLMRQLNFADRPMANDDGNPLHEFGISGGEPKRKRSHLLAKYGIQG